MSCHCFTGTWITDGEFAFLSPRNVFHRQLEKVNLPCKEHRNRHILFRRAFELTALPEAAVLFITADDYYKLYINGKFVTQGPAPAYHFAYGYNTVDVTPYLRLGRNVIAVHTLYQGLINRVWVSGDCRHGLLLDLELDGVTALSSDSGFLTHPHTGYTETGTVGYDTQFLETYDARAAEIGFEQPDFDDSAWAHALPREIVDYTVLPQSTASLVFEKIPPIQVEHRPGNRIFVDFGKTYVGYLNLTACGKAGEALVIRCGQELTEDGEVRFNLRANCRYEESFLLSGTQDSLDWFDYKSFRYVELILPDGCEITELSLTARHFPFSLEAKLRPEYKDDPALQQVWELCVNSLKYGVQEVIQDCMEREKGFYVGDGCYTALAHLVLTGDDTIVRKLIDDAFRSTFITPGMVTCLDCAMMQEIAEYPLMLLSLILWHYRLVGDKAYLRKNYAGMCRLLDTYRQDYEKDGLLRDLDKWCVVEWPANFRDGYDVDITEGKVCTEPHVALNAYYIEAIRSVNKAASLLDEPPYRDEGPLVSAFCAAFHDRERHVFTDSLHSTHASYIGNVLPFAFGLCPDEETEGTILAWIRQRGIIGVSFFGAFPLMMGLIRRGRRDMVTEQLRDPAAWLRMIGEGATTTYEGWGRDSKWNTSLFHLTMSDAVVFLADLDLPMLFA